MPTYFDFIVTIEGISPPIWRRFLLTNKATFHDLHMAIQGSFGWDNSHLFEFTTPGRREEPIAGSPYDELPLFGEPVPDADRVRLSSYFVGRTRLCKYLYDFGDSWEHEVKLDRIVEDEATFRRRLLGGARACPPEDIGGTWRYQNAVHILKTGGDPEEDDPEELQEWLGDWDPEAFDFEKTKKKFEKKGRKARSRAKR